MLRFINRSHSTTRSNASTFLPRRATLLTSSFMKLPSGLTFSGFQQRRTLLTGKQFSSNFDRSWRQCQQIRRSVSSKDTEGSSEQKQDAYGAPKSVGVWLLVCAGTVFVMVVVGGITRLTESGLSMTDWRPLVGTIPPRTDEEWSETFERYKQFPEFQLLKSDMTIQDFKRIFYWEWGHRVLGRTIGLLFFLPYVYFTARGRIPRRLHPRLLAMFALGGSQGLIGWWMVKSGLTKKEDNSVPRVSEFRLAIHLGLAFTIYSALLWHGLNIIDHARPVASIQAPAHLIQRLRVLKKGAAGLAALVFTTAMSGALVAGRDAGLIYNEWPLMGGSFMPPETFEFTPWYTNLYKNDTTIQFDHRIMAYITTAAATTVFLIASSKRGGAGGLSLLRIVPKRTRQALHSVIGMVGVQVTLGITTLLFFVPVSLGAAHQGGSLALLSFTLWLLQTLRKVRLIK